MIEESLVLSSNDDKVILTTHRIQMRQKEWGRSYYISIFLEKISSVQVYYKSSIIWLIISILAAVCSVYLMWALNEARFYDEDDKTLLYLMVGAGIVSLLLWIFSRKHIVSINPDGGPALQFQVKGMDSLQIEDFVAKVQSAKTERVNYLYAVRRTS